MKGGGFIVAAMFALSVAEGGQVTIDDLRKLQNLYETAQKTYVLANIAAKKCVEKEINIETLKEINMTRRQWEQALLYLMYTAYDNCYGVETAQTESALARYFWLEKKITGKNERPVIIPAHGKALEITLDVLFVEEVLYQNIDQNHEAIKRFSRLDPKIQARLKKIPELQMPFDMSQVKRFIATLPPYDD